MSISYSYSEIDDIIEKWALVKSDISKLEEKEKRYKKIIKELMKELDSDIIKGSKYGVKNVNQIRRYINRSDLPEDIFDKYSSEKEVSFLYLIKSEEEKGKEKWKRKSQGQSRSRTKSRKGNRNVDKCINNNYIDENGKREGEEEYDN